MKENFVICQILLSPLIINIASENKNRNYCYITLSLREISGELR